jgi:hypothetical protein
MQGKRDAIYLEVKTTNEGKTATETFVMLSYNGAPDLITAILKHMSDIEIASSTEMIALVQGAVKRMDDEAREVVACVRRGLDAELGTPTERRLEKLTKDPGGQDPVTRAQTQMARREQMGDFDKEGEQSPDPTASVPVSPAVAPVPATAPARRQVKGWYISGDHQYSISDTSISANPDSVRRNYFVSDMSIPTDPDNVSRNIDFVDCDIHPASNSIFESCTLEGHRIPDGPGSLYLYMSDWQQNGPEGLPQRWKAIQEAYIEGNPAAFAPGTSSVLKTTPLTLKPKEDR